MFKEGMEAEERECEPFMISDKHQSDSAVFVIGQESGRMVKAWYDSDGTRRAGRR